MKKEMMASIIVAASMFVGCQLQDSKDECGYYQPTKAEADTFLNYILVTPDSLYDFPLPREVALSKGISTECYEDIMRCIEQTNECLLEVRRRGDSTYMTIPADNSERIRRSAKYKKY